MFDFALKQDDYTWENALLWGNFIEHCKRVKEETSLQGRVIHVLIAAIELLPIISQISSLFEMIIVNNFRPNEQQKGNLSNKSIEDISQDVKNQNDKNNTPHEDKKPETLDQKEKNNNDAEHEITKNEPVIQTKEPKVDQPIPPISSPTPSEIVTVPENVSKPIMVNQAAKIEDIAEEVILEKYEPFSWTDIVKYRVPCGKKHDQLTEIEKILPGMVPKFFGFEDEQITSLFSSETKKLWKKLQTIEISSFEANHQMFEDLQKSIEDDIMKAALPLEEWQLKAFNDLKHTQTTLIVRSSSNEDGKVVNAGGNETISGVIPTEEHLKFGLAKVVSSYFSLKSFKNRAAFENPLLELPLCSVLIMEQISETPNSPIVSGVMMTNELAWSSQGEDGITHITVSWGFGNGTSGKVVCDEWAITKDYTYATIRQKFYRIVPSTLGKETKVANKQALREVPSLSPKQFQQLEDIAKKLEKSFEKAMNVEFVIKDENLYVVQARSIQSAPLSETNTYLDPSVLLPERKVFKGEMILSGSNQVVALEKPQIVYARNLEEAERLFDSKYHNAVIVYNYESSTTHPAVNFADYRPPIPCLVLPFDIWLECKNMADKAKFLLCTQSGSLVEEHESLSVKKGLFIHPARFPLSINASRNSLQEKSNHPTILKLENLLATTSELLKNRLDEIKNTLNEIFTELATRNHALTTNTLSTIAGELRIYSDSILENMKKAADKNQMTQLAFHAGMLRQLVSQSAKQVVGAHSLSGLEVATNLPTFMDDFIKTDNSPWDLALFGLNGFDQQIQTNWLEFLKTNQSSDLLEKLNKELEVLVGLDLATNWLSENFSNSKKLPSIETLITKLESDNKVNLGLVDLKAEMSEISDKLNHKQISSKEEFEELCKKLQKISNEFIDHCSKNKCKHPLIVDLIDLWDLSTKAVKTFQLYSVQEEEKYFEKRVNTFAYFAVKVSRANLLNYSLEELIETGMQKWGDPKNSFSVQHWLIPISHGALAKIKTLDQRLTVLHQNLLLASSKTNQGSSKINIEEHLPSKLAFAYKHFKKRPAAKTFSMDNHDFMSISHNQASVRINIPLNFHSTVVTLTQKKGSDEIEVTICMRGSDNPRGEHLYLFKAFAEIADIPLTDHLIFQNDLKVVFTVKDEAKIELLAKAIYNVNEGTIVGSRIDNIKTLKSIFLKNKVQPRNRQVSFQNRQLSPEEIAISDKVANHFWPHLERTGKLPQGFSDYETADGIWDLFEKNKDLEKIINRVIDEIDGKLDKSDFSKFFSFRVLELSELPIETHRKVAWEILKDKIISPEDIREEVREELFAKLFYEFPEQAQYYCDNYFDLFARLMDETLKEKETVTDGQAKLLAELVKEKNPAENWKIALRAIINDSVRKNIFSTIELDKLQEICAV